MITDQFKALNAAITASQSQLDNAINLLKLSGEGIEKSTNEADNKKVQFAQMQIEQLLAKAKKGESIDAEIASFSKTIKKDFPK